MTDNEIKRARTTLPKWKNDETPPMFTPEQERLSKELDCREMINSILCYWGEIGLNEEGYCYNEYLKKYVDELGSDTVKQLCNEQLDSFSKAVVHKDVFTDNDGISYNSIEWGDEDTLENKLAVAATRSKNLNDKTSEGKVSILQVKDENSRFYRFSPLGYLSDGINSVEFNNYDNIYTYNYKANINFADIDSIKCLLENIYAEFNINIPSDFKGHSLSVSDVVVLSQGVNCKAFYCDSISFKELPEKFISQFKEAVVHNLAVKLVEFAKDTDFYEYQDSLEVGETESDVINHFAEQLKDVKFCEGVYKSLTDYINEEDISLYELSEGDIKSLRDELLSHINGLSPQKNIGHNKADIEFDM